jgi:poly(A) polymerase
MVNIKGLVPSALEQFIINNQDIYGDIFLVGGAIRNTYLGRKVEDLDFITTHHSIIITKEIADHFHGNYYIMDEKRGTARALICIDDKNLKVDIALIAADTLNTDLSLRDFTMNAIALQLPNSGKIIDPLNGASDILNRSLKPCSSSSFEIDPVRVIRAVRFINEFDLSFNPIFTDWVRTASKNLHQISGERKRDEIVKILEKTDCKQALLILLDFGILENLFPEIYGLESLELDIPHVHNAWEHTCQVVAYCQQLIDLFSGSEEQKKINPKIVQAFGKLKKYSDNIFIELEFSIVSGRSKKSLLLLAAIFHDVGKGSENPIGKDGKKCFPNHAKVGAKIVGDRAKEMGYSNHEIEFLSKVVRYHMKLSNGGFLDKTEKDVQIYRLFKKTGVAGVFIGLLYLADLLATFEETIIEEFWEQAIKTVYNLFDAYFYQFNKIIAPPKMINGYDLINEFDLIPGKKFTKILNQVTEEQVRGKITSKAEAKKFVQELLSEYR